MSRVAIGCCAALAAAAALGGAGACSAQAANFTASDGATLAAAVQSADAQPGPSTIDLAPGSYAPATTLTIKGQLTIVGPSAPAAKIVGAAVMPTGSDLFDVSPGAHATFVDVILTDAGYESSGAAIDDYGAVDLESSTLAGDDAPALTIEPQAVATVRNATLSDGLDVAVVDDGSATLINSTVAGNAIEGIDDRLGTLRLVNTIVAANGSVDCSAPAQSSDDSLDTDGSCGVGALGDADPQLGPLLASNGGPTPTQALAPGSPAIGAGDPSQCPGSDQRGFARPGGSCDIGAYQAGAQAATSLSMAPSAGGSSPAASPPTGTSPGGEDGPSAASSPARPTGPAAGSPSTRPAAVAVRGHGALRAPNRSRITFTLYAQIAGPQGSLAYHDPAHHVWLKHARVTSVAIAGAAATARIDGSAMLGRRRVRFAASVVDRAGAHTLRISLSSGYSGGGRLVSGAIALIHSAGRA